MGKARTPNMQLRQRREELHLTQAELADRLGVSTLTVGRWERGEVVPTPYALRKLCTILEATPQALGFSQEEEAGAPTTESDRESSTRPRPSRLTRRTLLVSAVTAGAVAVGGGTAILLMHQVRGAPSSSPTISLPNPGPQTLKSSLVYTGHVKRVESVAWHPTDAYLASASADGIVRVWHSQNGDDLSASQCTSGVISWIAWSPDGQSLALCGGARAVWIIPAFPSAHLTPETCPLPYQGHQDVVNSCAWSPDSRWIASGGQDESLQVWSAQTKRLRFPSLQITNPISSVDWSPDGNSLVFGAKDGKIYSCDALTGQHLTTYSGHTDAVNAVAWAPTSQQFASTSDDGTVRIWNAATGHVERIYPTNGTPVDATAWSANGRYLATGGKDNLVRIWNTSTIEQLYTCEGNLDIVNAVAWSHHGYRIASAGQDKSVHIWDLSAILQ
ncbi:MAG TPA: helix-turn-helix domain-containing protein [Ktedonosporobacter sp.]|nr:helix-turn-helix domain-containing protein [Ktedonosporobacter sp.]